MKGHFATAVLMAAAGGTAQAEIVLDGILGGGDMYTSSRTVTWYNGHATDYSIYGDFQNQWASTTIQYGPGQLAGDPSGAEYFFLFVEVPLYAKNMIWDSSITPDNYPAANTDPNLGLTEADIAPYRIHHETHHDPGKLRLNYSTATGSEKMLFVDSNGHDIFKANLAGDADNAFGLIAFKDSVDYLFDNMLATTELSLARDRTMSFEFQFELDDLTNNELLSYTSNGIEFHLSPERGLVPAPGVLPFLGLAALGRRRRRDGN